MEVILLEKIDNLGELGDTVSVKPGFARNFLLPKGKALRATKENLAYFDAQKKQIEAENDKKKSEAEKVAKKIKGLNVPVVRAAAESGKLYGSVSSRDIADAINEKAGTNINRNQVILTQAYKMVGLFPLTVQLHPEVKEEITINIARSLDEAKIQEEKGVALIASEEEAAPTAKATAVTEEAQKEETKEAKTEEEASSEKNEAKEDKKAEEKKSA